MFSPKTINPDIIESFYLKLKNKKLNKRLKTLIENCKNKKYIEKYYEGIYIYPFIAKEEKYYYC